MAEISQRKQLRRTSSDKKQIQTERAHATVEVKRNDGETKGRGYTWGKWQGLWPDGTAGSNPSVL